VESCKFKFVDRSKIILTSDRIKSFNPLHSREKFDGNILEILAFYIWDLSLQGFPAFANRREHGVGTQLGVHSRKYSAPVAVG